MSAVDDALAELKKAEELLAAAQAVDAAELPKAESDATPAPTGATSGATSAGPSVASSGTPAAATPEEGKRGPMIKNGKLYPSVR